MESTISNGWVQWQRRYSFKMWNYKKFRNEKLWEIARKDYNSSAESSSRADMSQLILLGQLSMASHLCSLLGVASGWWLFFMLWEFQDSSWGRWVPFTDVPPQCFTTSLRRWSMTIFHPLFILEIWQEKMEAEGSQRVKLVLPKFNISPSGEPLQPLQINIPLVRGRITWWTQPIPLSSIQRVCGIIFQNKCFYLEQQFYQNVCCLQQTLSKGLPAGRVIAGGGKLGVPCLGLTSQRQWRGSKLCVCLCGHEDTNGNRQDLAPLQGFTTDIMLVFYGGQYLDLENLKY